MKIYLSKYLRPDEDNAKALNYVIENAKDHSRLMFTDGSFPISDTIFQKGRKIYWEGYDNTTLIATRPMTMLHLITAHGSELERINFKGYYDIRQKGDGPMMPGIMVSSVVRMRAVNIRNVWGSGLQISADIGHAGSNASHGRYDSMEIIECREHGVYTQGGDANQCNFYQIDARDCNGVGFYDNSFLGCQWNGCMAHNNKLGGYRAEQHSNRASFFGCYDEELGRDEAGNHKHPVFLAGHATWHGGLPANGIHYENFAKSFYSE